MNFLVLHRIGENGISQFIVLQNLWSAFNCPNGKFVVSRDNFGYLNPLSENTCNIKREDWEKCLSPISENQYAQLKELLND